MNNQLWQTGRLSLLFLIATTFVLLISLVLPGIVILSLPTTWPFLFIFGADETTEMYGRYGELIRAWICSIPTCLIYGFLIARTTMKKAAA